MYLFQILNEAQKLVEKSGNPRDLCRVYLKRIELIYFKFDPKAIGQKNVSASNFDLPLGSRVTLEC